MYIIYIWDIHVQCLYCTPTHRSAALTHSNHEVVLPELKKVAAISSLSSTLCAVVHGLSRFTCSQLIDATNQICWEEGGGERWGRDKVRCFCRSVRLDTCTCGAL